MRSENDLTQDRIAETIFGSMLRTARIAQLPMGPTVDAMIKAFAMFLAMTSVQIGRQSKGQPGPVFPIENIMKDVLEAFAHYEARPEQIAGIIERMRE